MGRKKIRIARISDERNRQVTFQKRKAGLLKKAFELSVLCDAEIAVLIFPPAGGSAPPRMYDYASTSLDAALHRLAAFAGERETRDNASFHDADANVSGLNTGHPLTAVAAAAASHAREVPCTTRGGGAGGGGRAGGGGGAGSSESDAERRHAAALHSMHLQPPAHPPDIHQPPPAHPQDMHQQELTGRQRQHAEQQRSQQQHAHHQEVQRQHAERQRAQHQHEQQQQHAHHRHVQEQQAREQHAHDVHQAHAQQQRLYQPHVSQAGAPQQPFPNQAVPRQSFHPHQPLQQSSLAAPVTVVDGVAGAGFPVQQTHGRTPLPAVRERETLKADPGIGHTNTPGLSDLAGAAASQGRKPASLSGLGQSAGKLGSIPDVAVPAKAGAPECPIAKEGGSEARGAGANDEVATGAPSRKNLFKRLRVQIPVPTVADTGQGQLPRPTAPLGSSTYRLPSPSTASRWNHMSWPPLSTGPGGSTSMLPLLQGQASAGPGASRAQQGPDTLWTPHGGEYPADPLVTPKGGALLGGLNGTAFPPLPSPTNAGLLPFPSARHMGPMPSGLPTPTGASTGAAIGGGVAGANASSAAGVDTTGSTSALAPLSARLFEPKTSSADSNQDRANGASAGSVLGKRRVQNENAQALDVFNPGASSGDLNPVEGSAGN